MRIQREVEEGELEYGRSSPAASQLANELLSPLLPLAALKGSYQLATSSSSCVPELGSTPSQFFYRYGATLEEYSAVEDEMDPVAYNNNQFAGGSGSGELGVWRKKKKAKSRLSKEQVKWLETWFKEETKLEPGRKNELAGALGLQPRQVAVWFQNRRARCRTKQLELDFQHLQTQYDLLLQDKHNLLSQISTLKELVRRKPANGKEEEELLEMLEVEPTNGEKPTHVNSHGHDDRSITMTCSDYAVTTEGEEEAEEEEEEIKMKKKMKIAEPQLSSNKTVNDDVEPRLSRRRANMSEDLGLSCSSNVFEDPHYPDSFNTNYNNNMSMTIMQNNNNNNNEYCSQSQYSNWERLPMQFQMGAKFGEGYLQLQDDLCCMFNPHHVHPDDTQALMGCFQETHN